MTDQPTPSPDAHLPLTPPVFHILLALAGEEMHGYGIMQDVARQTDNALQLGPGTLYGCLKRMLAAGLVTEAGERDESSEHEGEPDAVPDQAERKERRRYYRITSLGQRVATAEAGRLATALAAAKSKRLFAGERP